MGLSFEERGGRTCVYRCTSKRVPGKRDPVSRKEYLGVIDPSTGLVHPKGMEPDKLGRILTDGQFRCLDYGNVLIAHRAAENLGLDRILSDIFGKDAGIILAASICEAVDPCPIDGIQVVAYRLYLGDIIGAGTRLTRNSLLKAVDGIDYTGKVLPEIADRLSGGSDGLLLVGTEGRLCSIGPMVGRDGQIIDRGAARVVSFVNDSDIPVLSLLVLGDRSPVILRQMADRFSGSHHLTMVLDGVSEDPGFLSRCLMSGASVVVGCSPTSEQVGVALRDFIGGQGEEIVRNGVIHRVLRRRFGLVRVDDGWLTVGDDDSRFRQSMFWICAYVSKPLDEFHRDGLTQYLARQMEFLADHEEGMVFRTDVLEEIRKGPPFGSDGSHGMMRAIRDHSGVTVILSDITDWNEVMDRLDRGCSISESIGVFADLLFDRTGSQRYGVADLLVPQLASMIVCEMQRVLEDSDEHMDVRSAMGVASSYRVVVNDGRIIPGEMSRDAERVLRLFDIPHQNARMRVQNV